MLPATVCGRVAPDRKGGTFGDASSDPEDGRMKGALAAIPIALAVELSALYAVGAILRAGELRGAGLVVRDTLPLFTVEQ